MESESPEPDPHDGDDPFEGLVFDDDFIRSAAIVEETAAQRERAARQANLQRMLADSTAVEQNAEHAHRRFAPDDTDGVWLDSDERPPRRTGRLVVAIVVVLAVLVVYVLSHFFNGGSTGAAGSVTTVPSSVPAANGATAEVTSDAEVVRPAGWPSVSSEEQGAPIGTPPVATESGPHAYVQLQADGARPVAYDPCRPIHYVTRTTGAPDVGDRLVADAVATVSAATGLSFVDDGTTDEGPADDRSPLQPERYGDRWAPVLISWSDPAESPRLAPERTDPADGSTADVVGFAGSTAVGATDASGAPLTDQLFVTGGVTLDAPDIATMLGEFDGYARARAVVLHELGHLVGLDHVADSSQLMAPTSRPEITEFGAGDLQGLAAVGSGACEPVI